MNTVIVGTLGSFVTAYAESDIFGKLIFLGLFALSVMCWVVLTQKIILTRKVRKISAEFSTILEKNRERLLKIELNEFPKVSGKAIPHPFALVFSSLKLKSLEVLNKNHYFLSQMAQKGQPTPEVFLSTADLELLESHVMTTISSQVKALEKNLYILPTIVTLAPFLGLLGTVWGILVTFGGLTGAGSISSNSTVLGGLSTALTTTVLGLVIAIPALISYSYLKSTLRDFSSDMEDFLYQMLSTLELQYRKVDLG
jgi:biopolymer transport protein TolQ